VGTLLQPASKGIGGFSPVVRIMEELFTIERKREEAKTTIGKVV